MSNIFKGKGETVGKIAGPIIGHLLEESVRLFLQKRIVRRLRQKQP